VDRVAPVPGIHGRAAEIAVLGTSWLTSVRQLQREATARGVPLRQHIRSTTDTSVTAVYYGDAAALLGNAIALAGLGMNRLFGSPAPDAAAGIVIGWLRRFPDQGQA
jgi:hypothetical protein